MNPRRFAGSARIVACSSPVQPDCMNDGVARLQDRGWTLRVDQNARDRARFTAGTVAQRLSGIARWLQDPQGTHLWSARGGYGSMELLPGLARLDMRSAPGQVLGSSDLTSLQLWMQQQGLPAGLYTAMPSASIARGCPDATLNRLEDLLEGIEQPLSNYAKVRRNWAGENAAARGVAMGGCLTMVVSAVAAGTMPDVADAVLFLEDVGEHPFRIQRMLETLHLAGIFAQLSGVVLGTFPGCNPPAGATYSMPQVFADFFANAAFPVAIGHPFGHVTDGEFCDSIWWGRSYGLDPAKDSVDLIPG